MPISPPPTDRYNLEIFERLRASLAGRYELQGELGRGGMAMVYGARDIRHDRLVAVKVLPPELATAVASERFLFEIRTAAQLLHPHILGLIDSGDADGLLYYIMPHVSGESLRTKLERERTLPVREAIRITCEIASALAHAHDRGVVHRDIKPENILLADGSNVLVSDFGLARAILRSADRKLTLSQHIVGTAYYMSPEQAGSDDALDGRSDIYSLGCMLFEMLAGRPPFEATTEMAVLAQHLMDPPPPLAVRNSGIPVGLERVVHRALEKDPAKRYQRASELSHDLDAVLASSAAPASAFSSLRLPWPRHGNRRAAAVTALAGVALVAALALATPWAAPVREQITMLWTPQLDSTRFVIMPFRRGPGVPNDGAVEILLRDAFARWNGIGVVDQFQVHGAVAQLDTMHLETTDLQRIATRFSAGRFVSGDIVGVGDSLRISATLYDAGSGASLSGVTAKTGRLSAADETPFRSIADRLLFRGAPTTGREASEPGTTSYVARHDFLLGQAALQQWNLGGADSAFADAVAHDTGYAAAYLWLAQVRGWQTDNPQQWRAIALRAVTAGARLPHREQKLATALLHMANGEFPQACAIYQELRRADSNDFAATYGLGECVRRDDIVVPDRRSPTGFRFRASRFRAVLAYRDAFEMLPSIHRAFSASAFERLRGLFMTSAATRVVGHQLGDTTLFRAPPSWAGDTLVLYPYPMREELRTPERFRALTTDLAVDHQRGMFRDVAVSWRRAFPNDVVSREAMAVALELLGDSTALDTLRDARRLATAEDQRVRLAVQEVWLRVKFGLPDDLAGLTAARELADSLLTHASQAPLASAELLTGLAMLTGRVSLAATLARRAPKLMAVPDPVPTRTLSSARALLVYSAMGAPVDSIRVTEQRIISEVRGTIVKNRQNAVLSTLLGQAAGLAFPVHRFASLPTLAGHNNPLLDAEAALAAGDSSRARSILEERRRVRVNRRPAEMTLDITYPAAALVLALGDRDGAITWVDPVLEAAQGYAPEVISRVASAGALMRALALRVELARLAGDASGARRWARPITILWEHGDPSLRPVVQQMRTIASTRSPRVALSD